MSSMRYDNRGIVINEEPMYSKVLENRGFKSIEQYTTAVIKYPHPRQIAKLNTISVVWKTGDRFWKLASKYYMDPDVWWVIAWFNQTPTEAHLRFGMTIFVPLPLVEVLALFD